MQVASILKRFQPQRPHLAGLVVLLLLTFGMTLSLAWAAWGAARAARVQAEDTMEGWAALAATSFKERIEPSLVQALYYAFNIVFAEGVSGEGLIDLERVRRNVVLEPICRCLSAEDVDYWFEYDFELKSLTFSDEAPPRAVGAWLETTLRTMPMASLGQDSSGVSIAVGKAGGANQFVTYATLASTEGHRRVAYGFGTDPSVLQTIFKQYWSLAPLLPQATNTSNDSLLSANVVDETGIHVYATPVQYPHVYRAERQLGFPLAGLTLDMGVRGDAADALIIGGIPEPPSGRLAGLLAVTSLLIVSALFLIRREADLARLRADFIAGVSHELRTPLAQIRMFAETLLLGRVRTEAERTRSLEIIDQEARRLAHLVENVLIFAKSERRKSRINPQLTDLPADVREAVQGFAVLNRSRAIDLRVELQEGVAAPVDRGALKQVLLNLLDNAVKYGPLEQRITVGLALFGDNVRIWVDDEGPGIPATDREKVFARFVRLSRDSESPVGGSGIGLAIVRELVLLHGGRVWVEDAPGGRGARVVTEFPGAYVRPDVAAGGWAVA